MGEKQFPGNPPLPLMRNEKVIEAPANLQNITQRYTYESVKFIQENKGNPFFLYLPHTMPHNPVFASEKFKGKSKNGIYGEAVEEIDWSVGRIIQTLDSLGLSENTLVIFTSDNGATSNWGGSKCSSFRI
jgi:arylsulfatase A-like enzyme